MLFHNEANNFSLVFLILFSDTIPNKILNDVPLLS